VPEEAREHGTRRVRTPEPIDNAHASRAIDSTMPEPRTIDGAERTDRAAAAPIARAPRSRAEGERMTSSNIRVAMTVDDLFMWPGLSFPEGSSAQKVSRQLIDAFAANADFLE
jgi:hypothetical protein